jgi:hypothetical protein
MLTYVSACMRQISVVVVSSENDSGNKMIEAYLEPTRSVYIDDLGREAFAGVILSEGISFPRARISSFLTMRF